MISSWGIRKFLLRQPRAAVIRLTVRGVPQEIKPTRGQNLSKVADTVYAVQPEVIELFDDDGKLLRAIRPDIEHEQSSEQPKPPQQLTNDPETARFTHVAALLAKAYEHATDVAFGKLVELVERIDARTDSLEQRLERTESLYRRTLHEQLRDMQDEARAVLEQRGEEQEDGGTMLDQMFRAWAAGQAQGNTEPRKPKSNGAAAAPPNGSNGKA